MFSLSRVYRWIVLIGVSGVLPGFIMRCDKAALNFQRGFFEGLGADVSQLLIDQGLVT